jgi:6-phosphofructokinase 1
VNCVQTIDNDVAMLDRSFGFETSVEAAQHAIRAAVTEASCNLPNGIGIVKVLAIQQNILYCIIIVCM